MKTTLFTPGPGNTSDDVRAALNCDIGTRTPQMAELTKQLRQKIAKVANCSSDFSVVPLQGSGTFAVEAMLTSLLPPQEPLLILVNGPYGERMVEICQIYNMQYHVLRSDPLQPININVIEDYLQLHPEIKTLSLIHLETGIGIINPLDDVLRLAEQLNVQVFVDSMSAFGVLPIQFDSPSLSAVVASSNKALHGVPGVGFVISRKKLLSERWPARTLSLDIRAQYQSFRRDGMWRFTPPVQVISALSRAIDDYFSQGGLNGRLRTYQERANRVIEGLSSLGIHPLVSSCSSPVIITFTLPFDEHVLSATSLSENLLSFGIAIYPSKIDKVNSFRIGFIGELTDSDIEQLITQMGEIVLKLRGKLEQSE